MGIRYGNEKGNKLQKIFKFNNKFLKNKKAK